jgi:uncharacterized membrane protein YeiH
MDIVFAIVEYIGVVSFAISGTVIAINKKTDAVGALVFALLTCFGGGMIRDICLGTAPKILTNTEYYILALVALAVSLVCFVCAFLPRTAKFITEHSHDFIIDFTDAIGLSIFCVFGVQVAIEQGYSNPVVLVFCGSISGVGGGMLRDICSAEIPFIFRKHIYLIPTLCGAILYTLTYNHIPPLASMLIAIFFIVSLRTLAIIFKWNLPVPKGDGEGIKETNQEPALNIEKELSIK